jgi:hypothetical protein
MRLYASTIYINNDQAAVLKLLVLYILSGGRPTSEARSIGQLLNFVITHGLVMSRQRSDFRRRPSLVTVQ